MQVIRTIVWIVVTAVLVAFVAMNWDRAPVNFWPLQTGYLHFEWPVGVIAIVFFLLGFVPTYLVFRARLWRQHRRVASLESSMRAATAPTAPPFATSTQLEAEAANASHHPL